MEHNQATMLANLEQNLIELMADLLDSQNHQIEEATAGVKDPMPREQSELHIHMAKAALLEYAKTVTK